MYGVAASMIRRGVDTDAPWLPEGAIAHLDFTQGHYYANGVASVTSLIGNVDPAFISADGLYINAGEVNDALQASGALAIALADALSAGGLTAVMEIQTAASPGLKPFGTVIYARDASETIEITATIEDSSGVLIYAPEDTLVAAGGQTVFDGPDINRYAMTLGRDIGGGDLEWAASNNGGVAYNVTTAEDYSGVIFNFIGIGSGGGFTLEYANVRVLTFYLAVDPSELPTLSSAPGVLTLDVDAGTFTLAGINAALLRSLKMAAETGTFTLTGNNAGLSTGIPDLVANAGTFTLTGNASALSRALRMTASAGTFSLTGNGAALNKTFSLLASSGSFALTGVSNVFQRALVMSAVKAAFTVTGNAATLTYSGADPNFANVKLLCGFNGVDGATSSSDESGSPHVLTFAGNAQLDTAQTKFGSASLLLDGTGDGVLADNSADFLFGSGQFTIEGFVRFAGNGAAGGSYLMAVYDTASQRSWAFAVGQITSNAAVWGIVNSTNGTSTTGNVNSSAVSTSLNTWYHFAVDRDASNVIRVYRDGTMIASGTFSGTYHASTGKLSLGGFTTSGAIAGNYLNGWLDELRITKGVARYASDSGFTVPTSAYPRS